MDSRPPRGADAGRAALGSRLVLREGAVRCCGVVDSAASLAAALGLPAFLAFLLAGGWVAGSSAASGSSTAAWPSSCGPVTSLLAPPARPETSRGAWRSMHRSTLPRTAWHLFPLVYWSSRWKRVGTPKELHSACHDGGMGTQAESRESMLSIMTDLRMPLFLKRADLCNKCNAVPRRCTPGCWPL